jgi:hypothetical protein
LPIVGCSIATNVSGLCVVALSIKLKLTTTLYRAITQNTCYVPFKIKKMSLTKQNLEEIYEAMLRIKEIDRSNYFKNYFGEIKYRLETEHNYKFINCQVCSCELNKNSAFNYSGTCANCVD